MALPEGLLEAVRNYLVITWSDPTGDEKLTGIIARGLKYIDGIAGAAMDYTIEDKPRELLFEYCRYARSNALNEFQNNYLHELMSLQISQEIKQYMELVKISVLVVGEIELTPAFKPEVSLYTAETLNSEDIITVAVAHPLARVCIRNGNTTVMNGAAAAWVPGRNILKITITNGSAEFAYTVVVTKG